MNRPCECDNFTPGQPYQEGDCRRCWLFHNDPRYTKLWSSVCKVRRKPPTLAKKIVTAATAYGRWVLAGRPKRTADEVATIQNICNSCEHHASQQGLEANGCTECGCLLDRKIPMATEFCRLGKWPGDPRNSPAS